MLREAWGLLEWERHLLLSAINAIYAHPPLQLETAIAKFMGTEEAIIYSYDIATMSSVIPAFANRRDVLVVDEVRCDCMRCDGIYLCTVWEVGRGGGWKTKVPYCHTLMCVVR